MELTKKRNSSIPSYITWILLATFLYLYFRGLSKETISEIPKSTNIMLILMVVLFLVRSILEKILPEKEVLFANSSNNVITIVSNGRIYFKTTIEKNTITDVKIGKTYFANNLYIFLKNDNVKIISDNLSELERLKEYIENCLNK